MPYSTLEDILHEIPRAVLVSLADDPDNPTGDIIQANIDTAIAKADAIIDGYIGVRISLPIIGTTPTLTEISVDLAIYTLFSRVTSVPDFREKRFKGSLGFLLRFADGKGSIGQITLPVGATPAQLPLCGTAEKDFPEDIWDKF
jgi:phage gp36-like protein